MPEELVIITVISIIAGSITMVSLAKMLFGYLRAKAGVTGKTSTSSLTTSELEMMLRRVVEEANEPLRERVEILEASLRPPENALGAGEKEDFLELPEAGPNDLAAISKRQTGRQRTV